MESTTVPYRFWRKPLSAVLLFFSTVFLLPLGLSAENPHVGTYSGHLIIEIDHGIGHMVAGKMIFNVFPDGTVAELGGDPVGTVDEEGAIEWREPNTFNFTTGTIADGKLFSRSVTTSPDSGVTTTLRIEADIWGGAFPQGETFTSELIELSPRNNMSGKHVLYTGHGFIAVGDKGTVALSNDGLTWRRSAVPTLSDLRAVAYGDGTYLVVGTDGALLTSTDGDNWVPRNTPLAQSGVPHQLSGAAYGNGRFVITSTLGGYAHSTDGGQSWTVGGTNTFGSGANRLAFHNDKFVFVNGSNAVRFSDDGITWTAPIATGITNNLNDVAYANGKWIAVGSGIAVSDDGTTWTRLGALSSTLLRAVSGADGVFVVRQAGGNSPAFYASEDDLTNWQRASIPSSSFGVNSIAYGAGRFVMFTDESPWVSEDGMVWRHIREDLRMLNRGAPQKVFTPRDESDFVAVVNDSGIAYATDGILYAGNNGFAYMGLERIANKQGQMRLDTQTSANLYAVSGNWVGGEGGVLRRIDFNQTEDSTAPLSYTVHVVNSPTTQTLRSGANNNFASGYMVGDNGTIVTFTGECGGKAVLEASGTTANLRYVGQTPSRLGTGGAPSIPAHFIAVGDNGTLLVRENNAWQARETGTTANLVGVVYVNYVGNHNFDARYIAIGEDGTLISSPDTITWTLETPIQVPGKLTSMTQVVGANNTSFSGAIHGDRYEGQLTVILGGALSINTGSPWHPSPSAGLGQTRIAYGNGRFVVVSMDRSFTTVDGQEWQTSLAPVLLRDVAYGSGRFVAVGGRFNDSSDRRIYHSADGLNWTQANYPALPHQPRSVTYGGGKFFVSGDRGMVFVSEDGGANWQAVSSQVLSHNNGSITSMAGNGEIIVGVGNNNTNQFGIIYSIDGGATWAQISGSGAPLEHVAYLNGAFVAVGGNLVRYSTDGVTWSASGVTYPANRNSETPVFSQIFFANDTYVATSRAHAVAYVAETPAGPWQRKYTGVRFGFTGSATANGQVLLVNGNKVIAMATTDGGSPYLTSHPTGGVFGQGSTLNLQATATGADQLTYQWLRNGVPLEDDGRITGANTPNLTIENATPADSGDYRLAVINAHGARNSQPAQVEVLAPPAFRSQTAAQTVPLGEKTTLTATATGGHLSYQWYRNGVAIDGATGSSLELDSVQYADAGLYTVEVTNLSGSATSEAISLSVTVAKDNMSFAIDEVFLANVPELRGVNGNPVEINDALVQPDGKILLAGYFEYTNGSGQTRQSILRLNTNGTLDTTFNPPPIYQDTPGTQAARIREIAMTSNRIFAIGDIREFDGFALIWDRNIVAFQTNGSRVTNYSVAIGTTNNPVTSLAVELSGNAFYSGTAIENITHRFIYYRSSNGARNTSFNNGNPNTMPTTSVLPKTLRLQSSISHILFAGNISNNLRIGQLRTNGQANLTGFVQPNFGPIASNTINRINVNADNSFVALGNFTAVDGSLRSGIARFNASGHVDATFTGPQVLGANLSDAVFFDNDLALVGGSFSATRDGQSYNNVALLDESGALVPNDTIGAGANAPISRILKGTGNSVYLVGSDGFSLLNGQQVPRVVRLTATPVDPGPPPVLQIVAQSESRSYEEGDTVTLSVAAIGENPAYQWYRNGVAIVGANAATLVLEGADADSAGEYHVEVFDASGRIPGSAISLTPAGAVDPLEGWLSSFPNVPADKRGALDDASGNGRANILKFLLGNDPSSGDLPPVFEAVEGEDGEISFLFRTAKIAAAVDFVVQATQDLAAFEPGIPAQVVLVDEDTEFSYWQVIAEPVEEGKSVFVRLVIPNP